MADTLNPDKRSWNMSRIKGENTTPEIKVRSFLHKSGLRFRLNQKNIFGKPDIVLKKYKTVIFVDGCFWHRHKNCKYAYTPKSRKDFWKEKFQNNVSRDQLVNSELIKNGWNVIRIWECQISDKHLKKIVSQIK